MRDATLHPYRRLAALLAFLRGQTAGGLALLAASLLALIWSNDSGADLYRRLISFPLGPLTAKDWVNDGLMALFFLLVGLEIRREITDGQLSSPRQIATPACAALGGMLVPAAIYIGFNFEDPERLRGWAVPVATDIAFALAALSVLGRRVPIALKLFLTALAIIDDLGAIVVIATFYTVRLDLPALLSAGLVSAFLSGLNRIGIRQIWAYALGGLVLWACVLRSGIHPTIAGVALALIVPMEDTGQRLEARLSGWVTWLVLPLFGLANAGLHLHEITMADFATPAVLGTAIALLAGKPIGVFGATWLAVRSGIARLPHGLNWTQLFGTSLLCGIGFTMSLFIAELGFRGAAIQAEVKLAVFTASLIAAATGVGLLAITRNTKATPPSTTPSGNPPPPDQPRSKRH